VPFQRITRGSEITNSQFVQLATMCLNNPNAVILWIIAAD
jgi:hypothetical protein